MTVIENNDQTEDSLGRYSIIFKGAKNLGEIHNWLWEHYYGYKFAITFDETHDEYEEYPKEVRVYFMDEILEEAAEYADMAVVKKERCASYSMNSEPRHG